MATAECLNGTAAVAFFVPLREAEGVKNRKQGHTRREMVGAVVICREGCEGLRDGLKRGKNEKKTEKRCEKTGKNH